MQFTTNYELVPVSEKPDADGSYFVITIQGSIDTALWINEYDTWDRLYITHYLRPVPDSVVITMEQLIDIAGKVWEAANERIYYEGIKFKDNSDESVYPDKQAFIDNLLKSFGA